ncbi:MAG: TetR/AcrR family transcriptional regulator [Methanobacterium sp.]|jgi:AcrR family transcriptional regulator
MEKLKIEDVGAEMDEVEERILDSAMKVFSINGYKGATTIKIASEANVNEITIFRKFNSKENLLKAVIKKNNLETLEKLDSILCKEKDVDTEISVKTLGINLKEFLDDRIDFIIMLMIEGRKRPELNRLYCLFRKKMLEHLRDYFEEQMEQCNIRPVNPDILAQILISFIFQNSVNEKIFEEKVSIDDEKVFEEYTDILMRGVLNLNCKN